MISCSRDGRIFRFAGLAGRDHWTRGTAGFTDLVNLQQSLGPLSICQRRAEQLESIRFECTIHPSKLPLTMFKLTAAKVASG